MTVTNPEYTSGFLAYRALSWKRWLSAGSRFALVWCRDSCYSLLTKYFSEYYITYGYAEHSMTCVEDVHGTYCNTQDFLVPVVGQEGV